MNDQADSQLLRAYVENRSEAAFAELVRRHVDFVYSAARRMVCDSHLAEDVTQRAFVALAQQARQLADRPILSGWLHRTAHNLAANIVRSDVRRRAREQEAAAMNELLAAAPDPVWEQIAPHLDAALSELNEAERDAVLLRYFERKSAREMAGILGTSEDAAQKRVNRAVERLRDFFARHGVTVGASSLGLVLSVNAVQAAPAGLAVTTAAAAAALAGSGIAATATATAVTQTIAMTTLQKAILGATLAVAVGTGVYEARRASTVRARLETLEQQQSPLTQQLQELRQERDDATTRLAAAWAENERLQSNPNTTELLKLRGEVARLRLQLAQPQKVTGNPGDPFTQNVLALTERAVTLNQHLEQMPEKKIPELELLTESDWLAAAKEANFDTEADVRKALRRLREKAKQRLPMGTAIWKFTHANDGQLPADISQLKPYLQTALTDTGADEATVDAILQRYKLVQSGNVSNLPPDTWIVIEKAPVDKEYDSRAKFGNGRSAVTGTGIDSRVDPDDKSYGTAP